MSDFSELPSTSLIPISREKALRLLNAAIERAEGMMDEYKSDRERVVVRDVDEFLARKPTFLEKLGLRKRKEYNREELIAQTIQDNQTRMNNLAHSGNPVDWVVYYSRLRADEYWGNLITALKKLRRGVETGTEGIVYLSVADLELISRA